MWPSFGPIVAVVIEDVVVSAALFALGLFLIHRGFDAYRAGRLIRDTPTATVHSMALGRVELHGTAREAATAFDRPFTDGRCLYARYRIEEYRRNGKGEREWRRIDDGTKVAPFYLEDDTGRVLIAADHWTTVEISAENRSRVTVRSYESEPEAVLRFLRHDSPVEPAGGGLLGSISNAPRRYTQWVLPVDSEVYVFGGVEECEDGEGAFRDRLVVTTDESTGRFVVSDSDPASLAETYGRRAPLLVVAGLLVSALSLSELLG
ncbi:GIDE domain-containing protein [Natronorarus salvus]|uniref:GIDE domain-containing protein n=1 Tax=Natronorarus salvus TaxID=3117733 RepID=UPI002F267C40